MELHSNFSIMYAIVFRLKRRFEMYEQFENLLPYTTIAEFQTLKGTKTLINSMSEFGSLWI